jgi:hypothetical protein
MTHAQPEPRRRPANPVIGLLFALGFLVAAVLGVVPLIMPFVPAISADLTGQRTKGFILLGYVGQTLLFRRR